MPVVYDIINWNIILQQRFNDTAILQSQTGYDKKQYGIDHRASLTELQKAPVMLLCGDSKEANTRMNEKIGCVEGHIS